MKYANIKLQPRDMVNIGDWVQIFAIDNLYRHMGIEKNDIVYITLKELNSYRGEQIVLPISFPMYGYYDLSPDIIPVYLGISALSSTVAEGLRMSQCQPIGCRDSHTTNEFLKAGLDAYMGGCLTITLPKRQSNPTEDKVFLVDIPGSLEKHIPSNILKKSVRRTHIRHNVGDGYEEAVKQYEEYYNQATLVVTSKIHCAQPCLAAGIPVIFASDRLSFRHDVIRQFLPLYKKKDYDAIDWNPGAVELKRHKELLLRNAVARINDASRSGMISSEINDMTRTINDFYMKGNGYDYDIDIVWAYKEYIQSRYRKNDEFEYIMWGCTQSAELFYSWLQEEYSKAKLKAIIDIDDKKVFHGMKASACEILKNVAETPVFLMAGNAIDMAKTVFAEYRVHNYCICYNNTYVVDGVNKSFYEKE